MNNFIDACKILMTNDLFFTLMLLVVCDIFTGIVGAFINKEISSNISKKGITIHLLTLFNIIIMNWVLIVLEYEQFNVIFIMFYITSYVMSLIENLGKIGIRFPRFITNLFTELQKRSDEYGD